ncbi:MAG TPA: hypothetical protein VNQ32_11745 [Steroidobacteraceae bacterium]|nr:hypothetical protein [Steroidobacteraceae bacterium]
MKRDARLIATFVAVLTFTVTASAGEPVALEPVVGHEFREISAPGVTGVFWTRRGDHYTLQIQFNIPPGSNRLQNLAAAGLAPTPGAGGQAYPDVRIQLRDRNGATIPHLNRLAVEPSLKTQSVLRGAQDGARRSEVVYTFWLGDGNNADTLTLQIDGREFVEKVPRLPGGG